MVNGQLENSLRHEIETYLESRLSAMKQDISALQSLLNESLSGLVERQSDVPMEGSLSTAISEHLRAAHERGIELAASESSRAKASSDMAIVKAGITEINEQGNQSEILKALINRAASFAPRVAFFVIKGDRASGWRGRGFEGTVGDNSIQEISVSLSSDTVLGSAAKSLTSWSGGPGSHSEDHLVLNRLGEEPSQRIVAIPLIVRGRAVAVLYADSAGLDSESINLEALETLVKVTGMAVELLSARSAPKRASEPAAAKEPAPSYSPTSDYQESTPAASSFDFSSLKEAEPAQSSYEELPPAEMSVVEEAPAAGYDIAPVSESFTETPSWRDESPASSSFEPEESKPIAPPPSQTKRRYGHETELPVEVSSDEERRLHNDALRFARLLISEIKLYNEQKVVEGRSEHDLYDRLREYIDRSREMYDKRVKPEVASRYDYFHGELVNTLAEGDVSKLGSNYPGATVNA
ncbi:MAG TPA: hypothetical protein VFH91_04060 [Pyrinomonadaceae bacterium]|nr:hypothetical protein [Pyrinomonadaceae bacterium]